MRGLSRQHKLLKAQTTKTLHRTAPNPIQSESQQGDALTPEQYKAVEELGILVDKDDQGVLLQIFTKPLGDRWAPRLCCWALSVWTVGAVLGAAASATYPMG